jgi:hypothetical protein
MGLAGNIQSVRSFLSRASLAHTARVLLRGVGIVQRIAFFSLWELRDLLEMFNLSEAFCRGTRWDTVPEWSTIALELYSVLHSFCCGTRKTC